MTEVLLGLLGPQDQQDQVGQLVHEDKMVSLVRLEIEETLVQQEEQANQVNKESVGIEGQVVLLDKLGQQDPQDLKDQLEIGGHKGIVVMLVQLEALEQPVPRGEMEVQDLQVQQAQLEIRVILAE